MGNDISNNHWCSQIFVDRGQLRANFGNTRISSDLGMEPLLVGRPKDPSRKLWATGNCWGYDADPDHTADIESRVKWNGGSTPEVFPYVDNASWQYCLVERSIPELPARSSGYPPLQSSMRVITQKRPWGSEDLSSVQIPVNWPLKWYEAILEFA